MMREGTWATEIEILALSHVLKLDIYTYTGNRWVKYSAERTHQSMTNQRKGCIYLHHKQENHYNVVLSTSNSAIQRERRIAITKLREYKGKEDNFKIHKQQNTVHSKMDHLFQTKQKRKLDRKRYRGNDARRNKKLFDARIRYQKDKAFRQNCKKASKMRYANNFSYKVKTIARSKKIHKRKATSDEYKKRASQLRIMKYRSDETYRNKLKERSVEKYKTNEHHKSKLKAQSIMKYKDNEDFKNKLKTQSIMQYKINESFRNKVKSSGK